MIDTGADYCWPAGRVTEHQSPCAPFVMAPMRLASERNTSPLEGEFDDRRRQ